MPATHPEAAAEWTREAQSYGEGYDADDFGEHNAWLDSLPAGFPEPELTPEREREILEAFGGSVPF
jgi:hypothetical protein